MVCHSSFRLHRVCRIDVVDNRAPQYSAGKIAPCPTGASVDTVFFGDDFRRSRQKYPGRRDRDRQSLITPNLAPTSDKKVLLCILTEIGDLGPCAVPSGMTSGFDSRHSTERTS